MTNMKMPLDASIYISGHTGLLGSGILRSLQKLGYSNLILRTHAELDLLDQEATFSFFKKEKPDYVFLAAAKVGGIKANSERLGEFLFDNMQMQLNAIEGARLSGVKKLLFVASTCIYPANIPNPISEDQMLSAPFEPTNEGYAVAKMAGIKMCELYSKQYGLNFISAIPCNLYGLNDHYDPNNSHVLQSLIRKVHLAKEKKESKIELWGSGKPRREFMSSDDCADALIFLMNEYEGLTPVNIGTGLDLSIVEIAEKIAEVLEWKVEFTFDSSKPDGIYQKLSDCAKIRSLGWSPSITLEDGIRAAYLDFTQRGVA